MTRESNAFGTLQEDQFDAKQHDGPIDDFDHDDNRQEEEQTSLSRDALEAHRQVLEMAATIEILTRDFEKQQRELLDAYKRLQEYSLQERRFHEDDDRHHHHSHHSSDRSHGKSWRNRLFHRRDEENEEEDDHEDAQQQLCCLHEAQIDEVRKLVTIKDIALTEALQQRNDYKLQLEKAEAMIKELRVESAELYHQHHASRPQQRSPQYHGPQIAPSPPTLLGTNVHEVPRHERFDDESNYSQKRENDDLFWRKQYKEAVRMRKQHGFTSVSSPNTSISSSPLQSTRSAPSLKIFSFPNNQRRKGITDENVPFARYIGISARQNAIIQEHHRMLR